MDIYVFEGEGVWLQASVVIVAPSDADAQIKAIKWAEAQGVKPDTLKLASIHAIDEPGVVYGWNGDY